MHALQITLNHVGPMTMKNSVAQQMAFKNKKEAKFTTIFGSLPSQFPQLF
jgi:hypothetical protein